MSLSRLLIVLLCLVPPSLLRAQGTKLRLTGSIIGLPHVRSVQLIAPSQHPISAPATITDGSWNLRCDVRSPRLALLSFVSDVPVNGTAGAPIYRYNVPIFISPGDFRVETSGNLVHTRIIGSEVHDDYLRIQAAAAPYLAELQRWRELSADSATLQDLPRQVYIGRKIDSVTSVFREQVYGQFLQTKIGSPLTPLLLSAYWSLNGDPDRMLRFLVNLPRKYRYANFDAFRNELLKMSRVSVGQEAPDFQLRDTSGAKVSLASLRGKYVLVNFWGSWCVPCRMEAPNLVSAYQYFRARNFEVLGVGVERDRWAKETWLRAIRDDKLPGVQVSDFRFWDSPVLKKYAVPSIPQNVLVGPDGQIVARNLRDEHLWAELDRILPR